MSFKLTKEEKKDRAIRLDAFNDAAKAVNDAIDDYNGAMVATWQKLEAKFILLERAREEAEKWAHDVAKRIDVEFDDYSESWQDGDKGKAVQRWKDDYKNFALEGYAMDEPDQLVGPDVPDDIFDGLPEEVEG